MISVCEELKRKALEVFKILKAVSTNSVWETKKKTIWTGRKDEGGIVNKLGRIMGIQTLFCASPGILFLAFRDGKNNM